MAGSFFGIPLHSAPIAWQLVDVTFSDGATAAGVFTYDAVTDNYSDWNISVAAGILTAYNYRPGVDGGFLGIHPAGQVDFVAFPPTTFGRYIRLSFTNPLSASGPIDLLRSDNSGYECDNCGTLRYITSGSVSSVPEPPTLGLLPAIVLFAGVLRGALFRDKGGRR
jgi:hypothetical protein